MKLRHTLATTLIACFLGTASLHAQDGGPPMPQPTKEHEWLKKFAGEWESEVTIYMDPANPMTCKGSETARMFGGFWVTGEGQAEIMGMKFSSSMTLGYDPEKKQYIGHWIDNMSSHRWEYVGTVDASGNVLTLESTGPCPKEPGKLFKFRDVIEFKSADHRTMTSSMEESEGKWVTVVKGEFRRKK